MNMVNFVNDVWGGIEVKIVGGKFLFYEIGFCYIFNLESFLKDVLLMLFVYDI